VKLEDLVLEEDHKTLRILLGLLQRRKVKVFVGAGVTRAYGYPDWRKLLYDLAQEDGEQRVPQPVIRQLRKSLAVDPGVTSSACNFEAVAQRIESALAGEFLHRAVAAKFQPRDQILPSPTALEAIARFDCGPFFTTNFDPMLELLLAKQHGVLEEEVALVGRYHLVLEALQNEDSRKVVKLHGTYNESNDRVLTKAEYDAAYSSVDGTVAGVLRHLFCSQSVLFVGCSLEQDRTLTVLKEAHKFDPARWHYALVREDSAMEERLQRWRQLHINAIRFRQAPEPDSFAYLPALLQRLADSGRPIEVGAEPCLLAIIKAAPGGIKDGLAPKALIGSVQDSDDRLERDSWAPLACGDLLNARHTEEPNSSVGALVVRWLGKVPAPLPRIVAAAGCLLRHIRKAVAKCNSPEVKVSFGFGNPIRLQGDRYFGVPVASALHVSDRIQPLGVDAGLPAPLVFDTSRVDRGAPVDPVQFPGFAVFDPIEGVYRALDMSWSPGKSESGRTVAPVRLAAVCSHFQTRPSLLSLKCRCHQLSNQTPCIDLLEPLRKARRPVFDLSPFEKLFGILGNSIPVADLQLTLDSGRMYLRSDKGFLFKAAGEKRRKTLELSASTRRIHLFFDADEWEIKTEFLPAGITRLTITSTRASLPNLLHEWDVDPNEGGHNQIVLEFQETQ